MLMRRPLELRTTLTGFPARQFLDSAPSLSFRGASQFKAKALQVSGLTSSRANSETNIPTSYLFMCVSVWSKQCSPMRLFPERSRPPLPVYVNSSPRSYSGSQRQPPVYQVCSNSKQRCNRTADAPLRPQSPQPAPANKSHRYSARGSHQHEACEHLLRSPEGTGPFNTQETSVF